MTSPTRIPADVDRRDRLIGPFTARQLVILATTALGLYLAWIGTRQVLAPPVFVVGAVPIGAAMAALVLTTRDGLPGDQLLLAAIRHRMQARHLVLAPDGIRTLPRWLMSGVRKIVKSPVPQALSTKTVRLPGSVATANSADVGIVDLGADGLAVVAVAGTINLALRTPEEQDSLVAQLGQYLNSLRQPVQILIRTIRLDLTSPIAGLRAATADMSPELAIAAHAHADHLAELGSEGDLLRRQTLLMWREPLAQSTATNVGLMGPSVKAILGGLVSGRRSAQRELSAAARRGVESRLLHRLNESAELLAPLGVTVTGLDEEQATAVLVGSCNPGSLVPPSAAAEVITAADVDHGYGDAVLDDIADSPACVAPSGSLLRRVWFGLRCNKTLVGAGRFAPESLTIGARHLEVGADFVATLALRGYPREVYAGWLAPLLNHPGRVDVSLNIEPVDPVTAAARLRRQLSRLESSRNHDLGQGRLVNPQVEVAVEDAADLSDRIARGEGRLFRVGVYLTVHARSEAELTDEVAAIRGLAGSLLMDVCPLTYRATQGWVSTLPVGLDLVGMRRTLDTSALAAAFPFSSPQLPVTDPGSADCPEGVLYGLDAAGGLMFNDRFGEHAHNHNAVVLGRSGSGKSYLVKIEILRSLYRGIECIVIDPEDEYRRLADAVGGTYIQLGAPGVRLNPFDLEVHTRPDGRRAAPADAVTRRKLFLHTMIRVILGDQTPAQRAILDTALTATYIAAGITEDPATWTRPAPTLGMLRDELQALGSTVGSDLAAALQPFVDDGAFAGLLDGPTTASADGGLVVFSLRELPDELKTIGTLLVLDATWRQVSNPGTRRPRLITVDEAWLLMRQPAGAEFLFRAAKSLRKHWAGLTVASQDVGDVLSTDLGKAIVSNAATQILMRQAPQAIDEVGAAFKLSEGERQFLLSAGRGHGLLAVSAQHRAVFMSLASLMEHDISTSDPSELAQAGEDSDDIGVDVDGPALPADDEIFVDVRDGV